MARIFKEKFKTLNDVFDEFTIRNLFKLEGQGYFEELESAIAIGKEANVFIARKKDGTRIIVKIYRLSTCDYHQMLKHLQEDKRFQGIKKSKRQIIFAWAQREYRNLLKSRELRVNSPTPIHCYYNIVLMEQIGEEEIAQKLGVNYPKKPEEFLKKTIENIKKLYKGGMVHGDLSSFNILNNNETPVLIDFSQSTTTDNPHAKEYLKRDIKNTLNTFKKRGVKIDEKEVYDEVVGR